MPEIIKNIPLPGLRNIKTALSILIILIIYQTIGRDNEFIAITAAVLCLQDSVNKTIIESRNRVITTILGGIYGLSFIITGLNNNLILKDIGICLSCIIIIYICNLYNKHDLITNTLFVFILVVSVPANEMTPMAYATNRIIDTLAGILIALIINRFFFPPKVKRVAYRRKLNNRFHLQQDCTFIKNESYKKSTWAGGDALELLIYPKDCVYEDFDFKYRISVAHTIGDINLTYTPNYYRRTMILDGNAIYYHEKSHTKNLNKFDQDIYKGSYKTRALGNATNFNIMYSKGYECEITTIKNKEITDLITITNDELNIFNVAHYYSLKDNNLFTIKNNQEVVFMKILNYGDSLIIKHLDNYTIDEFLVDIKNSSTSEDEIVCIRANIK